MATTSTDIDDLEPGAARFDPALRAWVLSRYPDVSAALREPLLSIPGAGLDHPAANLAVREAGAEAHSPARLAAWRTEFDRAARHLLATLPSDRPVDLVSAFAAPWSLALAVRANGAAAEDGELLAGLARQAFLAAACSTDGEPRAAAHAAAAELARRLPGEGASIAVQSFVALSQTLPCSLAGAWLELFRHPEEAETLRARPELIPQAIEELLRYASPARAVFRRAMAPVMIGDAAINTDDRVVLLLSAANRDPGTFPDPGRLILGRAAAAHLAFGRGPHACLGAQLIRMTAAVATEALLRATTAVELVGPVEWIGGFAIRAPGSLPVILRRSHDTMAHP